MNNNNKFWKIVVLFKKPNILDPMPKIEVLCPFELSSQDIKLYAEKIVNDKFPDYKAYYIASV